MRTLRLQRSVPITGKDVFGRPAHLMFRPQTAHADWQWDNIKKVSQIDMDCVRVSKWGRHIYLETPTIKHYDHGTNQPRLRIIEHLLPLRYMGIVGICISGSEWSPYLMPGQILEKLRPELYETSEEQHWFTLADSCRWQYTKLRAGKTAYTDLQPLDVPDVQASITIDYKGLGEIQKHFSLQALLRNDSEFQRILSVGPQGAYPFVRRIRKLPLIRNWEFVRRVCWPDYSSAEARQLTLEKFAEHRFVDLLGALALSCTLGQSFAVKVDSVCSGHFADVQALMACTSLRSNFVSLPRFRADEELIPVILQPSSLAAPPIPAALPEQGLQPELLPALAA